MNYQEFKNYICEAMPARLGSNVKIVLQDVTKNNDIHLDGLTILTPKCNIAPTIYLNYYFSQYENGKTLEEICQSIQNIYEKNRPSQNIDSSFFTDYDKVRSRIVYKLVNYKRNQKLLENVPHYRFLDLAIIFCCLLETSPEGSATILIHNHHLQFWSITTDELFALAQTNTPRLLQYEFRTMTEILNDFLSGAETNSFYEGESCPSGMYVLTNQCKLNGAACILYPELLKKIADQLQCDLFLLPSSIHEVLIIPASAQSSCEELTQMVQDVNTTQLTPEEILSDHVYCFSRETARLTM